MGLSTDEALKPPEPVDNSDLIGSMPEIEIYGDTFSTGLEWEAERP